MRAARVASGCYRRNNAQPGNAHNAEGASKTSKRASSDMEASAVDVAAS
jgi:hypothetical protein